MTLMEVTLIRNRSFQLCLCFSAIEVKRLVDGLDDVLTAGPRSASWRGTRNPLPFAPASKVPPTSRTRSSSPVSPWPAAATSCPRRSRVGDLDGHVAAAGDHPCPHWLRSA